MADKNAVSPGQFYPSTSSGLHGIRPFLFTDLDTYRDLYNGTMYTTKLDGIPKNLLRAHVCPSRGEGVLD